VVRAVIDGPATVGVLPLPRGKTASPGGVSRQQGRRPPRVIARLPGAPGNARGKAVEALAIGRMAQEETGRDCSLFVIEASAEISHGLRDALAAVSLAPHRCSFGATARSARWLHMIEAEGFVRPTDPRFGRLAAG
jgi:hypothetical protein